jgi:hypothetical protein
MRQIRAAANEAIFRANEEADAAGFDSDYNPAVQRSLKDCLRRAESLLLLGLIDVGFSVQHPERPISEEIRSRKRAVTSQYTGCLDTLAEEIQDPSRKRETQEYFREKEFEDQALRVSEALLSSPFKGDPDMRRYAIIQARILQRRSEFTRQMREAVEALSTASRNSCGA